MNGSVKIIKFAAGMSILFLVLTYFITLNIENHIVKLNTRWISNNFALTIFGGAFASMVVVLLCEVQKYITIKVSIEKYMFYQALYLYQALFLMKQNIFDYQKNTEAIVPKNLLDETIRMIQSEIFALQGVDYTPFYKKSHLLATHQKFCKQTISDITPIMLGCNELRIAIIKTQMGYYEQNIANRGVTATSGPVKSVLSAQLKRVSRALESVNAYLENIDKYCGYRYDWVEQREQIHSNYVSIFEAGNFEKEFQEEG